MRISELITNKYKLRIPPTVYYDLLTDVQEVEEEQEQKCIWIKYDYRTICPKECGGENPYWRIPENMENLKYCPYCGREIEVEE